MKIVHGESIPNVEKMQPGQIPGLKEILKRNTKPKEAIQSKSIEQESVGASQRVPPIIYLANKAENGFEGEILAEFYRKFPQMTTARDPVTGQPYEPIFISSEHGDGLPDLF